MLSKKLTNLSIHHIDACVMTETILEQEVKERAFAFFDDLRSKRKIKIYSPQFLAFEIALKINKIDTRIEPADALHLACAIENSANAFITIDEKFNQQGDFKKI
ncbi:MAG: PIN domain-containing protein [Methanosarcinales archaeon]